MIKQSDISELKNSLKYYHKYNALPTKVSNILKHSGDYDLVKDKSNGLMVAVECDIEDCDCYSTDWRGDVHYMKQVSMSQHISPKSLLYIITIEKWLKMIESNMLGKMFNEKTETQNNRFE